jgi:hypothetical protein
MKTYVTQLISDILKAQKPPLSQAEKEGISFEEEMEAIENYAEGNNIPPSLSVECGLALEQFPPVDQLEDEEIQKIIDAFDEMLQSRNISMDMPENVPLRKAYPIIINLLNKEAWYFPTGMLHFDFCTGYAPGCELEEYCPCLKNWNEDLKEFTDEKG